MTRIRSLSKRLAALSISIGHLLVVDGCKDHGVEAATDGVEPTGETEIEKGTHGGRLLSDGAFQAEVTIYERGVPPQFRVYFFDQGKPVPPREVTLDITLRRFGGRVDTLSFEPEQDYLVGEQVVEEPHSFDVEVNAERAGKKSAWKFSQREGRVALSDEAVRSSAIEIESAGPMKMRRELELPGEIMLNGDKLTHVVPRMAGVVRDVRKNQGDDVKKGEIIAVLDSRELAEAKREYLEASQELTFAKRAFEREEGLWKKNISSEASYLALERDFQRARLKQQSARQQLEALGISKASLERLNDPSAALTQYELRAPFDGVIIEKNVATGQAVKDDDDIFTLADLSSVWVSINVYAKDINAVKVGQDVTVESDNLGLAASGKIVYVGALVGADTRSAKARVVLPDPERRWKPGLFVTVSVVEDEVTVPVAIKREGLQKFRDRDVVFTRFGDEFEARPLQLGRRSGEWVEVVSGLRAGEQYAAANSFVLKADVGKSGASHDH